MLNERQRRWLALNQYRAVMARVHRISCAIGPMVEQCVPPSPTLSQPWASTGSMLRVHWIFEKLWPVYIAAHKICDYELLTTYIALSLSEGSNISQFRPKDRLYIFRAFWYEKVYLAIHFISKVAIYSVCPSRKMFSLNMSLKMNRTSWWTSLNGLHLSLILLSEFI